MPWTRASELARALACPASAILPRVPDWTSDSARFGTELHAWKAGGPITARVQAWLTHQDARWTRDLLWPGGTHEVLLGVRGTSEWTWHAGTRDENAAVRAGLDDEWVAGEADWVEVALPWVDDLKTGWHPGKPRTLPQLRLYLLAVTRRLREPAGLVSITHWPRYPLGSPPERWTQGVLSADLETWWTEIEGARTAAKGGDPPVPGAHCKYCRCKCEHNPQGHRPEETK